MHRETEHLPNKQTKLISNMHALCSYYASWPKSSSLILKTRSAPHKYPIIGVLEPQRHKCNSNQEPSTYCHLTPKMLEQLTKVNANFTIGFIIIFSFKCSDHTVNLFHIIINIEHLFIQTSKARNKRKASTFIV